MKGFLLKTSVFLLPIVLGVFIVEIYIRFSSSAFSLKAKYFNETATQTIIILGSSHAQSDVNPRLFSCPAANLAYGSQDLKLDQLLFEKTVFLNKKPMVLLLEFSYHRLLRENPDPYWRNGLYENFYGLDLTKGISLAKFILVSSNLKFFNNFIVESISRKRSDSRFNQWGFNENDFQGVFKAFNYDTARIVKSSQNRLSIDEWDNIDQSVVERNISHLERISALCAANHIHLVLFAPPVFSTYRTFFKQQNIQLRNVVIKKLQSKNRSVNWMNFENDPSFTTDLFKNDDHLNSKGAQLFTGMLNDSINSVYRTCPK